MPARYRRLTVAGDTVDTVSGGLVEHCEAQAMRSSLALFVVLLFREVLEVPRSAF